MGRKSARSFRQTLVSVVSLLKSHRVPERTESKGRWTGSGLSAPELGFGTRRRRGPVTGRDSNLWAGTRSDSRSSGPVFPYVSGGPSDSNPLKLDSRLSFVQIPCDPPRQGVRYRDLKPSTEVLRHRVSTVFVEPSLPLSVLYTSLFSPVQVHSLSTSFTSVHLPPLGSS